MINDILAACVPIFIFTLIGGVVMFTTEPEEDIKFEDINEIK